MTSQCKHYACFASKFVGGWGDGMAGGLTRASSFVYPSAAAEERERKRAKKKKKKKKKRELWSRLCGVGYRRIC
jgi:hypothetical protein